MIDLKRAVYLVVMMFFIEILPCPFSASATHGQDYYINLSSSGALEINVAGVGNMTAIGEDNISVSTNCYYGYNFLLSTSVNNNNLYLNGNSANNQSDTYFTPSNGTASLKDNPNSWGYYYNSNASTIPTDTSVFNAVPTLSNPTTLRTPLSTPASSDINDNFNIYYGVSSSSSMPVGTYKMIPDTNNSNNDGTLVYQVIMADDCISYKVHFDPSGFFEGQEITGSGTISDQLIYSNVATPLTSELFTAPSGYYFAGWNTDKDGSGTWYMPGESVINLIYAGATKTLYAQWTDCPGGNICYDANVSNPTDVEGEMSNQVVSSSDTSTTLYAPNLKLDGYGFIAWNTKKDGTGTNYGPNQTLEFTAGRYSTGGLKLYANWKASQGNMQNWSGCSNMNIGDVTALKDTRDNDVYAVAKLADGNCWMIENLRLDAENSRDSNQAQGYGGLFIGLAESEDTNFKFPSPENSLYKSDQSGDIYGVNGATKSDIYQNQAAGCHYPRYNRNNTNIGGTNASGESLIPSPTDDTNTAQWYAYGNYYTWNAAVANTAYYMYSGSEPNTSICQKGWRLPKPSEYRALSVALGGLDTAMGSSTAPTGTEMSYIMRAYPNNYIFAGVYYNTSARLRGQYGKYLTSNTSASSSYLPINFHMTSTYVVPGIYNNYIFESFETLGLSVRCIAEP